MTGFPSNAPYRRRFTGPDRPSALLPEGDALRQRMEEITVWLDGQDVIGEATAILGGGPVRRCDPGE